MTPKPNPKIAEPAAGYAQALKREAQACDHPSVAASFEEFAELDEEAVEMELTPPSDTVKAKAEQILTALVEKFPRYYMVFPDDDGEVSIQTNGRTKRGGNLLIVCGENSVSCSFVMNGKGSHKIYDSESIKNLPDEFICSSLEKLG